MRNSAERTSWVDKQEQPGRISSRHAKAGWEAFKEAGHEKQKIASA
jgi:hypothetical protein